MARMREEELRAHLVGYGHNMGSGEPYNIHRLRSYTQLMARHVRDHEEEGEFAGHTHSSDDLPEALRFAYQQDTDRRRRLESTSPDMAPGMLVSELFDLPEKPRIRRVFNDRRRGDRRE